LYTVSIGSLLLCSFLFSNQGFISYAHQLLPSGDANPPHRSDFFDAAFGSKRTQKDVAKKMKMYFTSRRPNIKYGCTMKLRPFWIQRIKQAWKNGLQTKE